MKVGIIVIVFNLDCRIFLLQIQNIKKFCQDNYTIEIIDNSTNTELSEAIKYHAGNEGVNYTRTNHGSKDASHSHAFAANTAYKLFYELYDYFFYLDHDCIPVKTFSVINILGEYFAAGMKHGWHGTQYLWPGCLMWNNKIEKELINFNPIHELRVDTGGGFYKVIEKYKCLFFNEVHVHNDNFTTGFYNFYSMINDRMFIHFINSSGWNPTERNEERLNTLINITTTLSDTV